jgi:hypothetical protein
MSRYPAAGEITSICPDYLVELRGFEPMAIAAAARSRVGSPLGAFERPLKAALGGGLAFRRRSRLGEGGRCCDQVGGRVDLRQGQLNGPVSRRTDKPVEYEPDRCQIPSKREFNRSLGDRLGVGFHDREGGYGRARREVLLADAHALAKRWRVGWRFDPDELVVLNPPAGGDRRSLGWRGPAPQRGRADPF